MARRPRRRFWLILITFFTLLGLLFLYAAWPGKWTFTISPETTYITGPLDKNGYVDYVTALNERLSQGIKPGENANVLLWQVIGPYPDGRSEMPPEYFQWLGIGPPSEEGNYWIRWEKIVQSKPDLAKRLRAVPKADSLSWAREWTWTAEQEPELADYLKQNQSSLAVVVEATRRRQYYNPIVPGRTEELTDSLLNALVTNVQQCREFAGALTCRAMLRLAQGHSENAWQDLIACHRLGRLISRGGTLIELLVAIAIERMASTADLVFLNQASLKSTQIQAFWNDLEALPAMAPLVDKVGQAERFATLQSIMLMAQMGPEALDSVSKQKLLSQDPNRIQWFGWSVNCDPALRNINCWYDGFTATLNTPNRSTRAKGLEDIVSDLKSMKQRVDKSQFRRSIIGSNGRGEWIGNIIAALMLPSIDRLQGAVDRSQQDFVDLHFAFALAAYRADQGKYPDKLNDLAPKYLPTIPLDLFSEKPLIYRLEGPGYLLYSVGPNGKDDDGRGNDDTPKGDDLAIRMPPRDPRPAK